MGGKGEHPAEAGRAKGGLSYVEVAGLVQRGGKGEVEGAGLGRSICKAVGEEHGERNWVESQVGRGSAFFVTIAKEASIEAGA